MAKNKITCPICGENVIMKKRKNSMNWYYQCPRCIITFDILYALAELE